MTATRRQPSTTGAERPRTDPRLAARRRLVARRQGTRRMWLVAVLTAVATIAIGAITVANSSLADVDNVEVSGLQRADEGHVLTASGLSLGMPLLDINTDETALAVASVPWIASADVAWSWGGDVTITVVERTAVAALPTGARHALIDADGIQLEVVTARPDGFPVIEGVEVSGVPGQRVDPVVADAIAVARAVPSGPGASTGAVIVESGQLYVELTVGGRAYLGDGRDIDAKLVALDTILSRVDLSCIETIDVRVPSTPTVRRTTAGTPTQEPLEATGGC